jgi:hypothetical protein
MFTFANEGLIINTTMTLNIDSISLQKSTDNFCIVRQKKLNCQYNVFSIDFFLLLITKALNQNFFEKKNLANHFGLSPKYETLSRFLLLLSPLSPSLSLFLPLFCFPSTKSQIKFFQMTDIIRRHHRDNVN